MRNEPPFWEKPLSELTHDQWEAICDGCAQCCLIKLSDTDSGELAYTDVVCHLLDLDTCRCTRYEKREIFVPTCYALTIEGLETFDWVPRSCAYRRLWEGRGLPAWHPLLSGDPEGAHKAGVSARCIARVSEQDVSPDDLLDHMLDEDL